MPTTPQATSHLLRQWSKPCHLSGRILADGTKVLCGRPSLPRALVVKPANDHGIRPPARTYRQDNEGLQLRLGDDHRF